MVGRIKDSSTFASVYVVSYVYGMREMWRMCIEKRLNV